MLTTKVMSYLPEQLYLSKVYNWIFHLSIHPFPIPAGMHPGQDNWLLWGKNRLVDSVTATGLLVWTNFNHLDQQISIHISSFCSHQSRHQNGLMGLRSIRLYTVPALRTTWVIHSYMKHSLVGLCVIFLHVLQILSRGTIITQGYKKFEIEDQTGGQRMES